MRIRLVPPNKRFEADAVKGRRFFFSYAARAAQARRYVP